MPYKQKHEVLKDMLKDKASILKVMQAFAHIVIQSFKTDRDRLQSDTIILSPQHKPTSLEIKARTDMCYDLFMAMRYDLRWSTQRSLDMLPVALRTELDGGKWTPQEDRHAWGEPRIE